MNLTTIIGLIAGLLTTGSFLPQIIKTIRTKDTKSISLHMYIVYTAGIITYFIYAYLIKETALLITNSLSFISGIMMLVLKLKYK